MEIRRKRSNIIPPEILIQDGDTESSNIHLAAESFIKHCRAKNLAKKTIDYHRDGTRGVIKMMNFLGIKRTDELAEHHVRDYILYRLESGIKPATINQNLRTWKVFGNYLEAAGHVQHNPFAVIERLKVEQKFIETFNTEQLTKLLETPNRNTFVGMRDHLLMMLFLETGCRLREALEIKLADIDWQAYLITVNGKGRKQRHVPFQDTFAKLLRQYIKVRGKLDHDYLFVSIENRPLKNRSIIDNFTDYGRRARIRNVRCTPHTWRYTFARLYIQNGGDPFSLKAILGHTTMTMVDHYVQMWGTDLVDKHAKYSPVERLFNK